MKVQGRIKKLLEPRSGVSAIGNAWRRQDFILEYFERPEDQYAETVCLQVMNDRIDEYDMHEGDEVIVDFGHRVNEYQGRIYTEMRIRSFEKVKKDSGTTAGNQLAQAEMTEEQKKAMEKLKGMGEQASNGDANGSGDDLPF